MNTVLSLTNQLQSAIECLQCSNQQGHLGAKFGEEEVDRCKPNFNMIWRVIELLYAKEIVSVSSAV